MDTAGTSPCVHRPNIPNFRLNSDSISVTVAVFFEPPELIDDIERARSTSTGYINKLETMAARTIGSSVGSAEICGGGGPEGKEFEGIFETLKLWLALTIGAISLDGPIPALRETRLCDCWDTVASGFMIIIISYVPDSKVIYVTPIKRTKAMKPWSFILPRCYVRGFNETSRSDFVQELLDVKVIHSASARKKRSIHKANMVQLSLPNAVVTVTPGTAAAIAQQPSRDTTEQQRYDNTTT